ncbi:MAG TPA: hypothetical protein PL196_04335 [Burkholderiaceae bacterium]|nr:hypothetical protein [Burkholderiaceae bacterium]
MRKITVCLSFAQVIALCGRSRGDDEVPPSTPTRMTMASPTAFTASLSRRDLGVGVPRAPVFISRGTSKASVMAAEKDMVLPAATGAPPG